VPDERPVLFGHFTAPRDPVAAEVVIAMLPVVLQYLVLQRRFIEGITAGEREWLATRTAAAP